MIFYKDDKDNKCNCNLNVYGPSRCYVCKKILCFRCPESFDILFYKNKVYCTSGCYKHLLHIKYNHFDIDTLDRIQYLSTSILMSSTTSNKMSLKVSNINKVIFSL